MLKFDEEKIREILSQEGHYPEFYIDRTIKALKGLRSELQAPLDQWLQDRTFCDQPDVEGVTLQTIQQQLKWDFIDCLILMDSFLKDPRKIKRIQDLPKRRPL